MFSGLLAIVGMLGAVWHPLVWAWLPFFTSLAIVVAQAVTSAARNVSLPAGKKNNPRYRLLIIFFHLIQPMARLCGRINYGLTPWRKRGAGAQLGYMFAFRTRSFMHWSESWRSAEDWLTDIERELSRLRMTVRRGGSFNRWDLQASSGLFSRSRSLLTIEEHGGGKQYLRLRCWPVYSLLSFGAMVILMALAAFAALDEQWAICGVFGIAGILVLIKIFADAGNATYSMKVAFGNLAGNAPKRKMRSRKFKGMNSKVEYEIQDYARREVKEPMEDEVMG